MPHIPRVRRGDSLSTNLTANAWNAFGALVNGQNSGGFKGGSNLVAPGMAVIDIKNATENHLRRFSVLGVGATILSPASDPIDFLNTHLFTGALPTTASYWNKPAVLLEDIPAGYIGQALVSGVTAVSLVVDNVNHRWADVTNNSTDTLTSYATGSVRILSTLSATGTQWALVQLGHCFKGTLLGKADATITDGTSGTVSVWHSSTSGTEADSTYNITVKFLGAGAAGGQWCAIEEVDGYYYGSPLGCS